MKTIYLVRHGESEANAGAPLFQGEASLLTPRGHEQARFIAERCRKLSFDVLLASPAVRTQATAKYISDVTGKPIITEPLLVERQLPDELIGKPQADRAANEVYEKWERSFFEEGIRVGTGENFDDLKKRAGAVLEYLGKRPESSLLLVSHGFLLRMIVARITFGEALTIGEFTKILQAFRTANTGLSHLEYQPKSGGTTGLPTPQWLIRVWNDHAHLG